MINPGGRSDKGGPASARGGAAYLDVVAGSDFRAHHRQRLDRAEEGAVVLAHLGRHVAQVAIKTELGEQTCHWEMDESSERVKGTFA